jgi:predicted small secreted protein
MKILTMLVSIILGVTLLTGCKNTVDGVGQDMQDNGKSIRKAVNEK